MVELKDDEIQTLTEARGYQQELEAFEFAYDAAVRALRRRKLMLEFLGFIIAIGFLYVLYIVRSAGHTERVNTVHDVINLGGTGVALVVLIATVWGHMAKWDGQLEKKLELSREAHRLVGRFDRLVRERPVPIADLHQLRTERLDFDSGRKHDLATLPQWAMQQAHQHVAMKYSDQKIKCKVCNREWTHDLARRRRWVAYVPLLGCESCGV